MRSWHNGTSDKNTNIKGENQKTGKTPYLKNQDTVQPSLKKPDTVNQDTVQPSPKKRDTINGDTIN